MGGDREQSFALMVSSAKPSLFILRVCIHVAAAMAELVYVELWVTSARYAERLRGSGQSITLNRYNTHVRKDLFVGALERIVQERRTFYYPVVTELIAVSSGKGRLKLFSVFHMLYPLFAGFGSPKRHLRPWFCLGISP